jgi:hypothetical protein
MKIRILGNSLRFRLTVTEVGTLCQKGYVEEQTHFPNATFTYAVKMVKGDVPLHASLEGRSIVLSLPETLGLGWDGNSVIGFEEKQEIPGGVLSLLLEKDFACLEKREEDDRDTYPNPKSINV